MNGEELKDARLALGFSQQKMGDALGMSLAMIGFMERGYSAGGKPVVVSQKTAMAVWCLLYESGVAAVGDRDEGLTPASH